MNGQGRSPEVADIFRRYGQEYRDKNMVNAQQNKVMKYIGICRTAALGGHVEACDTCGHTRNAYNSCRDRHGPKYFVILATSLPF
jgi:hypothetical protein